MARPRTLEEFPSGFIYKPGLLTADEERSLLDEIERLSFDEIRMHGVVAKRTAKHFGLDYDYEGRSIIEAPLFMPPPRGPASLARWGRSWRPAA